MTDQHGTISTLDNSSRHSQFGGSNFLTWDGGQFRRSQVARTWTPVLVSKNFREVIFHSDLRLRLLLEKRYPQEHRFTEPMSFDN